MKRRKFFKNAGLSVLGTAIPFKGEMLSFNDDLLAAALSCAEINDRVLVIVRLQGANDGLNTFIPYENHGIYREKRKNIRLEEKTLKLLDSTVKSAQKVYLHPKMEALRSFYEINNMGLIQGVGYDNYNYSHFTSDEVLWKGNDIKGAVPVDSNITNGMLARYISAAYNVKVNEGIGAMKDPYVIQFGNPVPITSFKYSSNVSFEFNGNDFLNSKIKEFAPINNMVSSLVDKQSNYVQALNYIKLIQDKAQSFGVTVEERYKKGINKVAYDNKKTLHRQLKMVARLIKGGAKTKIYQCTLTGFDTHANQVLKDDHSKGKHADLLEEVSTAISNFMLDLSSMGLRRRVVLMSYSEFGRKVVDNGSGTDHGNVNPIFLVGPAVRKGIVGNHPNLKNLDDKGRFMESETKYNFKQVYGGLLRDWLGADMSILEKSVTNRYKPLNNLINRADVASTNCSLASPSSREASEENVFTSESATQAPVLEYTAYPNPTSRVIYLKASDSSLKGKIQTTLYDEGGHVIYSQPYDLGSNSGIDLGRFPTGIYFLRTEDPVFGSSTHKIIKE